MWLPTPIYEALPYLYVLIGGLAVGSVESLLALCSGGMLIAMGMSIWYMRRRHREAARVPVRVAFAPRERAGRPRVCHRALH